MKSITTQEYPLFTDGITHSPSKLNYNSITINTSHLKFNINLQDKVYDNPLGTQRGNKN